MNFKHLFCKHDFMMVGRHTNLNQTLWLCVKCGKYLVHHEGLGLHYTTNTINEKEWRITK